MSKEKCALCVGVNQFKNYPSAALRGCVNDARAMATLLQKYYGFVGSGITVLENEQATKAGIMKVLQKMVADAQKGDYRRLVFSFSSHGTQVPDLDGDESDRADEAFCPHDLAQAGDAWDAKHIILDDELHKLFMQLPANVELEVFLDTCHSGTGLKAIDLLLTRKPRYVSPPSLQGFLQMQGRKSSGLQTKLLKDAASRQILWAACRDDQTSADAYIEGDWHGAFTYCFCQEMDAVEGKASRKQILKRVRARLKKDAYTQTPQLEIPGTRRG